MIYKAFPFQHPTRSFPSFLSTRFCSSNVRESQFKQSRAEAPVARNENVLTNRRLAARRPGFPSNMLARCSSTEIGDKKRVVVSSHQRIVKNAAKKKKRKICSFCLVLRNVHIDSCRTRTGFVKRCESYSVIHSRKTHCAMCFFFFFYKEINFILLNRSCHWLFKFDFFSH